MTAPFLVIGYGNELRGDDAVGPRAARRVAAWRRPGVAGVAVHQLTPELALSLRDAGAVVFVDACADPALREVCVRPLQARSGVCGGHAGDPRWLLALTEALYDRRPNAWLVAVPAADFGLGARLSPTARAGLAAALRQIGRLVGVDDGAPAVVAGA